jgi:uncharacterized membrane protein YhdT
VVLLLVLVIQAMVFHKTQEVEGVDRRFSAAELLLRMILWLQAVVVVELIFHPIEVEQQPSQEQQILELVDCQDLEAHKLRVELVVERVFTDRV